MSTFITPCVSSKGFELQHYKDNRLYIHYFTLLPMSSWIKIYCQCFKKGVLIDFSFYIFDGPETTWAWQALAILESMPLNT